MQGRLSGTEGSEAVLLSDFAPMANGGSGDVRAGVVFAGFGFSAPGQ